ncbi:LysR family transcriptional regulator [Parazoarcus communis]|uniref:LysR family transcriptional regulator n=1 Tax=Parazoarcus communis TaxID=41977 RepID=A0A2U8GZ67_9RHOO|nr:LysR family transcriptional regulator [Parazoarcus communis]
MTDVELYHLKTFVTVAEEKHLTRASERLFTSQPAISAHIKALEEELNLTLFDRTPKGMQLTAAGEQLLDRAQRTLAAAGDFLHHAKGMQNELLGSIRIGLNTDAEFLRLVELQAGLRAHYPQLDLEFMSGRTGNNIPALRVGKLDAAFVSGDCDEPLLDSHVLREEEMAVAVPNALRDQIASPDIPALARLPWVYTSPDCAYYQLMQPLFESHCCMPVKTMMADQEDAMRAMVAAGVGLGIMRRSDVEAAEREGRMHALPMKLPTISLRFAYLRKRANDPIIRAVVSELSTIWGLAPEQQRQAV